MQLKRKHQQFLYILNIGPNTIRFKVKSENKNIKFEYKKGPISPGIKLQVSVIIEGVACDVINENIKVCSENEIVNVLVQAGNLILI